MIRYDALVVHVAEFPIKGRLKWKEKITLQGNEFVLTTPKYQTSESIRHTMLMRREGS